ncbi:unnamed protein product [Sphagnum tenellum]
MNEQRTKKICLYLLSIPLIYLTTLVTYFTWSQTPFSIIVETCMLGQEAVMPDARITLILMIPNTIFPIVTLILDATVVCLLRKKKPLSHNEANKKVKPKYDTIPIRATVVSALQMFPSITVGAILKLLDLSPMSRAYVCMGVAMLFVTLRSPGVAFISFRYKRVRDTRRNEETKAMRLQKVLKEALEEGELRRMRSQLQAENVL